MRGRARHWLGAFVGVFAVGVVSLACGDVLYVQECSLRDASTPDTSLAEGRCNVVADCPQLGKFCFDDVACTEGRCAYTVKNFAEPVGDDPTPGDCHRPVCDGFGEVESGIDDSDAPSDGNPCTRDFCIEGIPHDVHPAEADGTVCVLAGVSGSCSKAVCVVD